MSCPHAHQQNGAAERKHRHIVEVGLSLLAHASIPLKFWDEAFLAATYLINRTPTKVLNFSTPFETLLHEKPDYSMLRVFGCACWPNLRPYNSHKLSFRSKRCVFWGYSNMHKGFKCLDVSAGRIYISRDVIFDEHVFPFSELHANAGAKLREEINLIPTHLMHPSYFPMGTTMHTDVINSSNNLPVATDENFTENNGQVDVFAAEGSGAEHEVDPAPAVSLPTGASETALSPSSPVDDAVLVLGSSSDHGPVL